MLQFFKRSVERRDAGALPFHRLFLYWLLPTAKVVDCGGSWLVLGAVGGAMILFEIGRDGVHNKCFYLVCFVGDVGDVFG